MSQNFIEKLAVKTLDDSFRPLLKKVQEPIYIYGAGDLTRYLQHLCASLSIEVIAIIDDYSKSVEFNGVKIYPSSHLQKNPSPVLLATIKSAERMIENLKKSDHKGKVFSLIDPFCHTAYNSFNFCTPQAMVNQYKDIHKGKRCFIIGNGPSLLKTNPLLLENEYTIACNNIFLINDFVPTYYTVEDKVLTQDRAEEINALPWTKFFPSVLSEWLDNGIFLKTIAGTWPKDKFSTDLTKGIEVYYTVTYAMLQLAYYLGFEEVYLIGIDHNYIVDKTQHTKNGNVFTSVDKDPNHFHGDYFGKGYRWHDPRVDRMEASYQVAKEFFEADGRKIYNSTAGGKLEVFPRIDFKELVNTEEFENE
jgi:hypothetical protein